MDSTAEDVRDAKRARLTPSAGDDVDLISSLEDDVRLRVLGLMPDATDAARAAAISRRWLRLWARVPALRFASRPVPRSAGGAEWLAALDAFVSFVDGALARHAQSGCAIESLSISYTREWETASSDSDHTEQEEEEEPMLALFAGACFRLSEQDLEQLMLVSVGAAQGWIRHAFQHGVRSLVLDMPLPVRAKLRGGRDDDEYRDYDGVEEGEKKPLLVHLDGLPSPAGLETMRLALGGARLRLSAAAMTMRFASLKDLSLERIKIADRGGARLLARLVSSASCPLLRKLRMSKLRFPNRMRLDARVLSELWVEDVSVMSLELRTPSLRVLRMDECCHEVLSLSAPRLEEFALFFRLGCQPHRLLFDGDLPRMASLNLCIWSHRGRTFHWGEHNDGCVLLLKRCSALTCLEVTLDGPKVRVFEDHVDLIKDKVPHQPQITSLTVNVSEAFERHDFGAGVANLLTRFTNLRDLSLHLPFFIELHGDLDEGLGLECDHPDHWTSNEISLAHLKEIELTGLTGTDCELWFMHVVLASAKRLCKVAISFNRECWQRQCCQVEGMMDTFERVLLDEGMQTSCRVEHKLTCILGN
ncbi:unnamed protein product [Urochloa decumbens]|uniref:F-box domain-containing protein n=1 Tax=Urochloa decumbens TaxID=240449 RepID=A0ABC9E7B3_9POAL